MDLTHTANRLQRRLEELARFTATQGEGCTRLPFTPEARQAADYLKKAFAEEGLEVREDTAGNIIGRRDGAEEGAKVIMAGSHYDSVKHGGNFDGIAGIITSLEAARLLRERGVTLRNPLEVIGTNDEEGLRFSSGLFGAKAILGLLDADYLKRYRDEQGVSIREAMEQYGLDPTGIGEAKCRTECLESFIEPHIEQGPVLEQSGCELGIVETIVGMRRYLVTVTGRPDHAGTTPMDLRVDAVDAASQVISRLSGWAREEGGGMVATAGFIQVMPNAMNIVPQETCFSVDIRSRSEDSLDRVEQKLRAATEAACRERSAGFTIEEKLRMKPVGLDGSLLDALEKSADSLGFSHMRMTSGAGHDSLEMAPRIPTAMLFVPSRNGRRHCPEEWTDYICLAKAAHVIADVLAAKYGAPA